MQVHNGFKRESAKSQRVTSCGPILIWLSMSTESPRYLKGPENEGAIHHLYYQVHHTQGEEKLITPVLGYNTL